MSLSSAVRLVAQREVRTQLRSKGFVIGLLLSALIIAAVVAVPQLLTGADSYRVGVAGSGSEELAAALRQGGEDVGGAEPGGELDGIGLGGVAAGPVIEVVVADEPAVRDGLAEGELDAAVIDSRVLLTDGDPDEQLAALLQQIHAQVATEQRLLAAGLDSDLAREVTAVPPLEQVSAGDEQRPDGPRAALAFFTVVILFLLIIGSAMQVAMGVVEEKSSRIVEILLVAVRPWQLLGGKIAAFAVLGLIQLVVFAAVGIAVAGGTGSLPELPTGMVWIVLVAVVAFLFGFVFYAAVAAALASLVSRQEEVGHVLSPLTLAIVASYGVGIWAAVNPAGLASQVLSMTPPFAAMVMPVRIAAAGAAGWEVAVAVLAMAAATAAVLAAAGRIYQRAVLRTGARLKLREAWRGPRIARTG